MITINLTHIHAMRDKRPEGYVDEVLALGEVKNGVLHVTDRRGFRRLQRKYADREQFRGATISQDDAKIVERSGNIMDVAGPPLWAELHTAAKARLLTPEWLEEFALRIPCGICRSHWLEMLKDHPPRYDDQYAWSVEVHNVVNVRLGKPVWAIDTDQ